MPKFQNVCIGLGVNPSRYNFVCSIFYDYVHLSKYLWGSWALIACVVLHSKYIYLLPKTQYKDWRNIYLLIRDDIIRTFYEWVGWSISLFCKWIMQFTDFSNSDVLLTPSLTFFAAGGTTRERKKWKLLVVWCNVSLSMPASPLDL